MRKITENSKKTGFTIVELIVVIVVIAILATITLVAYNSVRDRAKATAIIAEIENIEKSFHLMAADQFVSTWWRDTTFTGSNNPTLNDIISNTNTAYPNAALLKKYIPEVPSVSGMNLTWTYDNDGDTPSGDTSCLGNGWNAVILYVSPVDETLQKYVDKQMDDGDLNCGRVRKYSSTGMLYQLSFDQKI